MKKPNGYTTFENAHIVCIVTGFSRKSQNIKTGPMLQSFIIPKMGPLQARASGLQAIVCGDCPLQASVCYVEVGKSVQGVWNAWVKGRYPKLNDFSVLQGKRLRIGSWGDPAFIPAVVWKSLVQATGEKNTGYTHQWRKHTAQGLVDLVMASCDSAEEQIEASKKGWRTFRVIGKGHATFRDEIICPAESRGTTCHSCRLCNGKGQAKSVAITIH